MNKLFTIVIFVACSVVYGAAPVAVITCSKTITDGHITVARNETVCFDGRSSTDADSDPLTYKWSFGDGGDSSAAPTPCHMYRKAGSYAVKLTVSDAAKPTYPFLTGMTPASYTPPGSGWTLVRTQDFETGLLGANEYTCGGVTTVRPHTGNYSNQSIVNRDDDCTGWQLGQGVTTGTELYLSWWEYMDYHGKNNDERFLLQFKKTFTNPTGYLQIRWQYLNNLNSWATSFNIDSGYVSLFAEGDAPGATPSRVYGSTAKWISCGFGQWRQWEVYYRPAVDSLKNGETMIYLNGLLKSRVADTAFNGRVNMTGSSMFFGGATYTKIDWGSRATPGECSQDIYHIDTSLSRPRNFTNPCRCPGQCPPDGYVPVFNTYVDDIIIYQRTL